MLLRSLIAASTLVLSVIAQASQDPASASDYSCSATKPCKLGCCGKNNVCGLGPDYCSSENCQNSCDAKSECDPGWGAQWSSKETCPLNVCCSKYGFCGTTSEFCGNKTVTKPSCGGSSSNKRTIGYYEGWSTTRACYGMAPEEIPAGGYTHLNYAFAFVDPQSYAVAPMSDLDKDLYPRFTAIKETNPGLQTWISIGGWSMNDPDQPTASTFSNLAASDSAQQSFFKSLISFMETYGFDGVDIDWEYPVAPERSGKPADFQNYVSFLKALRGVLGGSGHNYGLSITLPSSYWYMQNFDIVNLEPLVDWFNVMTYDLHGTWDSTDRFIGAIVNAHTNLTEIDLTMDLFWRNNINPGKIVMGLGFYGRSFTLSDPSCTSAGCPFSGGANPGPCSANAGTLMNSEIQDIIANGAVPTLDQDAAVKQIVWNSNQWVSYDDADTFKMKIDYANGKCLGGTMVWAVSTDDSNSTSTNALAQSNGLSQKSFWGGNPTPKSTVATCIWGECGKSCPAGSSAAQRSDGKNRGDAGIYTYCPAGQTRPYCCPSDKPLPTCQWRGTAPFCKGQCHDGEVQVASDTSATGADCWTGHKVLCCTQTESDAAIGQCKWEGSAPFCGRNGGIGQHYGCDESDRQELTYDSFGSGGEQYCVSGYKSLCCTQPPPYQNCAWTKGNSFFHPFACSTGCPDGKQIIALDPTWCDSGSEYFCCDAPLEDNTGTGDELNFCQSLDGNFVESDEYDDDGNPADLIELYWYENEVFVSPTDEDPDIPHTSKRSTEIMEELIQLRMTRGWDQQIFAVNGTDLRLPQVCTEFDCFLIPEHEVSFVGGLLDEVRQTWERTVFLDNPYADKHAEHAHLVERARQRSSVVKLPRNRNARFYATAYYGVGQLDALKKKEFWTGAAAITKNICTQAAGSFALGRVIGRKYVAEHVTELQTPAQFAQSLIDGKYPTGDLVTGVSSGYDWTTVFDDTNGIVHMTWSQLGIARPAGLLGGDTPIDSIYWGLGSKGNDGDTDNMLICDAQTNSIKTSAWSIHTNIIGADRWKKASPGQRMAFLNAVDKSFVPYMNSQQAQEALGHAYDVQQQVFKALDQAAASGKITAPGSMTFQALHKTWYQKFFQELNDNVQLFLTEKYKAELSNWAGGGAYGQYTRIIKNSIRTDLTARQKGVNNLIIATAWLT